MVVAAFNLSPAGPSRKFPVVFVILLLGLAFGLRVWRIGGPYEHFDERIAVQASQHLGHVPGWDINWKVAVPEFGAGDQYNFSSYLYATHLFRRVVVRGTGGAEIWQQRGGLLAHRLFSVLCGTAAVGLVLLAGYRRGGAMLAFAAGGLAAVNPQLIQDAHYARPEAFMTLLVAALIWLGLGRVSARRMGVMGLLIGLAAASKASNVTLLLLAAVVAWTDAAERSGRWWRPDGKAFLRWGAIAAAGAVLGWMIGVPYALLHGREYLAGLRALSGQYAGSHPPQSLPDYRAVWPLMRDYYMATHGWTLLAAMGLGAALVLRWREGRMIGLLVAPLLASIWLFGSQRVFFERNLSPVLPGALLLGATGFVALFGFLRTAPVRSVAVALAVALASLPAIRTGQLLLADGLNGRDSAGISDFRGRLAQDYPGIRVATGSLFSESEFTWLDGELLSGGGELVYIIQDFNDAYKPYYLPGLFRRFNAVPVAIYRGTFADYPCSSLINFHGHRLIAFRLRPR